MKTINITLAGLMVSGAFARADDATDLNQNENRFTLSARLGFNIKAKFSNRLTPDRLPYNYLDGYVLPDSAGGYDPTDTFSGITQNWGYDNSTRQRDGTAPVGDFPAVAMTRFASGVDPMTRQMEDDPTPGLELGYLRRLGSFGSEGKWHYGIEAAVNFQKLDLSEGGVINDSGIQDYYQYFNGIGLPDSLYQGHFSGAPLDSVISGSIAASDSVLISLPSHRKLDADIWGFRLGPYIERQFGKRFTLNAIGGLAVAVVDGNASWSQQLTVGQNPADPTIGGRSHDSDVLWGYYLGANATYHISQHWDVTGGVQYQDIGTYHQGVGERNVDLDFSNAIFIQLGISYCF